MNKEFKDYKEYVGKEKQIGKWKLGKGKQYRNNYIIKRRKGMKKILKNNEKEAIKQKEISANLPLVIFVLAFLFLATIAGLCRVHIIYFLFKYWPKCSTQFTSSIINGSCKSEMKTCSSYFKYLIFQENDPNRQH